MADDAVSSLPMTFGEPMETLDSVPGNLNMPQVTSRPVSGYMRQGSRETRTHECIPSRPVALMPDWSPIQKSNHLYLISINPCISRPKLITILKSDSDEDMRRAPALTAEWIRKLAFLMMNQFEMHYLNLFCSVSAFTWFQWPNRETWKFLSACARVG